MELRKKRDDSLETALVPLGLLVRWGFGGIWRNHAAESMPWWTVSKKVRELVLKVPLETSPQDL